MATKNNTQPKTTELTKAPSVDAIALATKEIEDALASCNTETLATLPALSQAVALANGMVSLRKALSDEVMQAVFMPLMGTPLGFTTDRDRGAKDRDGRPLPKYTVAEVRDVMIEAMINGLRPVNNEICIISGRMYAAKNGVVRRVKTLEGLTDLYVRYSIPVISEEKQEGVVSARATFKYRGEPRVMSWEQEKRPDGTVFDGRLRIKKNKMMGPDAILGKAARKIHNAIYETLAGGGAFTVNDADTIEAEGETIAVLANELPSQKEPQALPEPDSTLKVQRAAKEPAKPSSPRTADLSRRPMREPGDENDEPPPARTASVGPDGSVSYDPDTGEVDDGEPVEDVDDGQMSLTE